MPGAPAFLNVHLEESVVGVEDVKLPVTPSDTQRTPALLLILQGKRFRLRLCDRSIGLVGRSVGWSVSFFFSQGWFMTDRTYVHQVSYLAAEKMEHPLGINS